MSRLLTVLLLVGVMVGAFAAPRRSSGKGKRASVGVKTRRQPSKTPAESNAMNEKELSVLEQIISYDDSGDFSANDSVAADSQNNRYDGLTDRDFEIVAKELGVEVAAIKAVVDIEGGSQMKGVWAAGVPVINFDRSMYARFRSKAESKAPDKNAKVPPGLKGYAHKEWSQLVNARRVNAQGANLGTFWGMFQIGGFNYRQCGCKSVEEFVERMSYSDFEQLELFAAFITSGGMLQDLRNKNWAGFARKYNGPGYARRGYHTRMAAAYRKYSH